MEKCDLCGRCSLFCPQDAREICGKEYTVDEVLKEILKDKTFYDNSGGGVTDIRLSDRDVLPILYLKRVTSAEVFLRMPRVLQNTATKRANVSVSFRQPRII